MEIIPRKLGATDYQETLTKMQVFTMNRNSETPDELWLTEHSSVYTLGLNRRNVRLPANNIPVVRVDRGGKITYHGLGQIIIYCLIDLKRRELKIRTLVDIMESSVVDLLQLFHIKSSTKKNAPGIYVNTKKIASVGLRIKNNCCYHGLSVNVDMDLSPFNAIDPCGYAGLEVTQTKDLNISLSIAQISDKLLDILKDKLETFKP